MAQTPTGGNKIDDNKFAILLRKGWYASDAALLFGCRKTNGTWAKRRIEKRSKPPEPLNTIIMMAGTTDLNEEELFELVDLYYEACNLNGKGGKDEQG